jgi:hypothetical protein
MEKLQKIIQNLEMVSNPKCLKIYVFVALLLISNIIDLSNLGIQIDLSRK